MEFDVFQVFPKRWAMGDRAELHNVRVVDVVPGPGIYETLTVERDGATRPMVSGGRWNAEFSPRMIGKAGHLVAATPMPGDDMPAGACYFREYMDQSLRRVPELDDLSAQRGSDGRVPLVVGWRCDAKPQGFRAPLGLIPGANGDFIPDETEAVTVRVPPEFVRECRAVGRSAAEVLRGFIGDLAGTANYFASPRADGYCSNGSDERMYAENWLDRAYGMDRVDLDALDAAEEQRQEQQDLRDELGGLMDDFVDAGGSADDLLAAVAVLVDKQRGQE